MEQRVCLVTGGPSGIELALFFETLGQATVGNPPLAELAPLLVEDG